MSASPHQRLARARSMGVWLPSLTASLCVLVLAGLPPALGLFYFGLDTTHIDLGTSCELRAILGQGLPPWLSPAMGNGGLLFGNPAAQLLYPPRLLLLALPVDLGVSLFLVLHLAIAAGGATWLLRSFKVRPLIAVSGGIAFAASGTAIDLLQHSYYLPPVAWLPWTWAACRRGLAPGAWRGWPAMVGLGIALCLLGGEPQGAGIALVLVLAECGWQLWRARRTRQRPWRQAGVVLGCAVAGLAAGFAPWPAFFAEAQLGTRGGLLDLAQVLHWSFDPPEWVASLLPGRLFSSTAWRALFVTDPHALTTWNPAPYLGAPLLLLWLLGSLQRQARLPALLGGVFLLAALGRHTPFYPALVTALPPLALFRYPQKYLLVMTLAAVVVAALQAQRLDRLPRARHQFAMAALPVLVALLASLAGLSALAPGLEAHWRRWREGLADLASLDAMGLLRSALLHVLLILGLAVVAALATRRPGRWLAALLVLDLGVAATSTVRLGPALADLHAPLSLLPASSPRVLCAHPDFQGVAFLFVDSADAPWAQQAMMRINAVPERQACDGLSSAVPYAPGISRVAAATTADGERLTASTARALGCTHLLHLAEDLGPGVERERFDALPGERARQLARAGPPLYRIVDPISEHFVARRPRLAVDENEVLERMQNADSAAAALTIVDDPLHRLAPGTALPDGTGASIARAHWPVRSQAELELAGQGGAVVGLRTAYLVGWEAKQAGRALPVLRVSGTLLGVLVDDVAAGPVALRYRSPGLLLGALISLGGLLALLGLPWWLPPPRRRSGSPARAGSRSDGSRRPAS